MTEKRPAEDARYHAIEKVLSYHKYEVSKRDINLKNSIPIKFKICRQIGEIIRACHSDN